MHGNHYRDSLLCEIHLDRYHNGILSLVDLCTMIYRMEKEEAVSTGGALRRSSFI